MNRKRDERKAAKIEEKKRQEAHNKRMAELRMQVILGPRLVLIQFKKKSSQISSSSTWTTMRWTALLGVKAKVGKVRSS